jgi:2-polyprenyl-3-methyl-5-hydroxy-6-metoxy-1,4-benzoquinol methylase
MPNDLTDSRFWDKKYSGDELSTGGISAWFREKIHWKFDRMICRMLDATGKEYPHILELGCAPGTILERIHRLRPRFRLSGIDYSEDGMNLTRERMVRLGIEADIQFGDFRTVNMPIKYDAVISFGLIEHFEDPSEILKCHKNLVALGGLVAVSVPNFSHSFVEQLLRRFDPEILITHNLAIMNEKSMACALEKCGLVDVLAGGAGGPRLYFEAKKPSLEFRLYHSAARAWNILTAVTPDVFWQAHIWGIGRRKLD